MMTSILQGVLVSGTAEETHLTICHVQVRQEPQVIKKTDGFVDIHHIILLTVWVGYDNPKTISDLYGNTYPLRIWREFMSDIHQGLKNVEFKSYDGEKSTSSSSGYSGSYGSDGNTTATAVPTIDPDASRSR